MWACLAGYSGVEEEEQNKLPTGGPFIYAEFEVGQWM